MIYVETNAQNVVVYLHYMPFDSQYGLGKTEDELAQTGFLTDNLPGPARRDLRKSIRRAET